jgi:hypothetical protein
MSASPLRRWLRRQPHPTRLRVDGRDVAIATGAQMWVVTEESVRALNPSRVEAIDGNGVMLRALMLDRDEDDQDEKQEKGGGSDLVQLARLLAEAHDSGARRHAEAYALAFSENTKLVSILAARLGGLETAWQKAMQQSANAQAQALMTQAQLEGVAAGDDPAGQAIGAMLASALANGAKANGAPKAPKKGGAA